MANIKKGDLVQVISGPTHARGGDRGKQGKVIEILSGKDKILVEGINYVTKHIKVGQTQRGTKTGGVEQHEIVAGDGCTLISIGRVEVADPARRIGVRDSADLPAHAGIVAEAALH